MMSILRKVYLIRIYADEIDRMAATFKEVNCHNEFWSGDKEWKKNLQHYQDLKEIAQKIRELP